ncbi:hypothetical protein TRFO_23985 [Tritrichomonas foetus]|uniref:BAR domain-containing protein n=1 Tax=Tritrichomonas foetus TaxID=1144522 RepID=A0A1J4KDC3_9EUKA|nr:hypothetical protein TRFO_23985 [Tritrichomonas foetus]|eukprot:OHT07716.1 hypothetical protein TRFO_23985 [Tritrichomonas foetus]
MANFDLVSQNMGLLLRDVKNLSPIIRKDLASVNEKDRSVGFLCEQLSESCQVTSQHQRPTVQSALIGFATILARVELARKSLYQRISPLAGNFLLTPASQVQQVSTAIKKRDTILKKAQRLPPAQNDPKAAQNNAIRTQAQQLNAQAIQEVRAWSATYHEDIRKSFREYAHAQMEFAAKALEEWSIFIEDLTLLDFNRDTDEIITMLEEGGGVVDPNQ